MNKIFNFFRDIYDYLFYSVSLQERRFKSEYELLKQQFIADHHSNLVDTSAIKLEFSDEFKQQASKYSELCRNIINLLHPDNRSAKRLDTDSKIKLINVVRREQIREYDNYECDTRIKQILVETAKLDAWRKDAIIQLLNKYKDIPTDETTKKPVRTSLYEAAYIRDVHFDNLYYKSKIARRTISFLNWVLVTLLLLILVYSAFLEYGFDEPRKFLLGPFSDLWLVLLFGLLGAAFSTLLNLYKGDKLKNTIIKQIDAKSLTIARLVIGASAALIAFLILNSNLIIIKGFNDTPATYAGDTTMPLRLPLLSLIFVAGFTERFVLNFIDKLSAQAEKSDEANKEKDAKLVAELTETSNQVNGNGTQKKEDNKNISKKDTDQLVEEIITDEKSSGG